MALLWNERSIRSPAINTQIQKSSLDTCALRALLDQNISIFSRERFDDIAALASRLIARRASSFRSKCGFTLMRQTNVAMCRLNDINIVDTLETFCGTIPDYKMPNGKQNLPTRDNFDFVIVTLQSTAKLLLRIACCARKAAVAFLNYVHRGFFVETSVLYVGVLSQIWEMACALCTKTILFYNGLMPFRRHLSSAKAVWLPVEHELPANLEDFLGDQWQLERSRPIVDSSSVLFAGIADFSLNDLGQCVDVDMTQSFVEPMPVLAGHSKKPIKQEFPKIAVQIREPVGALACCDVGVAVSRDTLKEAEISIDKVRSCEGIRQFMKAEKERRKSDLRPQQISDCKWNELQLQVKHILSSNEGRNCVKKFKTLWYTHFKNVK